GHFRFIGRGARPVLFDLFGGDVAQAIRCRADRPRAAAGRGFLSHGNGRRGQQGRCAGGGQQTTHIGYSPLDAGLPRRMDANAAVSEEATEFTSVQQQWFGGDPPFPSTLPPLLLSRLRGRMAITPSSTREPPMSVAKARVAVLISGTGSNMVSLIEAGQAPDAPY